MLAFTIAARKGGQTRSTTAFHLAGAFASLGLRVVVVDADPQPTVSKLLLGHEAVEALPAARTLAAVYDEADGARPDRVLHATGIAGISCLPGSDRVRAYDHPAPPAHPGLATALRTFVPGLAPFCDVLLMDTAPNAGLLTFSALAAADGVLSPVVPEVNAVWELGFLGRYMGEVRAGWNPGLRWLGVFAAAFARRLSIHREYCEQLAAAYPGVWLPTPVPESVVVKQAAAARRPLPLWKPRCAAAKAFVSLAEALLERAGRITPTQGREVA